MRVSTEAQTDKYGFTIQKDTADAYAEKIGVEITETYKDVITGTSSTRYGLEKLKREAARFDLVIIPRADRLARDMLVGPVIVSELMQAGLQVHLSDYGAYNPNDPASVFMFALGLAKAHTDHRTLTDNLRRGKLQKAKRGERVAPIRAYGYRDDEPYEPEAEWVRQIFQWRLTEGSHTIARRLNDLGVPPPGARKAPAKGKHNRGWYHSTVVVLTHNRVYKGEYEYGRGLTCAACGALTRLPDHVFRSDRPLPARCRCGGDLRLERYSAPVPAIVSAELWDRVNDGGRADYRARARPGDKPELFPLQGRVFCGVCDGVMSAHDGYSKTKYQHHRYYYCRGLLTRTTGKKCDHRRYYRTDDLHEPVLKAVREALGDDAVLAELLTLPAPRPVNYEAYRASLETERANAKRLAVRGLLSDDDLEAELSRLSALLAATPETPPRTAPADAQRPRGLARARRRRLREQ